MIEGISAVTLGSGAAAHGGFCCRSRLRAAQSGHSQAIDVGKCHIRTHAPQQFARYSNTSSALTSRDGGIGQSKGLGRLEVLVR